MHLTAALLGVRYRSDSPWIERWRVVTGKLLSLYGTPTLGNFRDPVREIFYILLSAKTTDAQYRLTHKRLFVKFPLLSDLASASFQEIHNCVASGGFGRKRAVQIRDAARQLVALGKNPSRSLLCMSERESYEYISSLPGMGPKSALCVIMYSLDRDGFPVDVNVQRIAERMGAIPRNLKHYRAQKRLAAIVPDGCSRPLHIGLVVHGRTICLPRKPKCEQCPLQNMCRYGRTAAAKRLP